MIGNRLVMIGNRLVLIGNRLVMCTVLLGKQAIDDDCNQTVGVRLPVQGTVLHVLHVLLVWSVASWCH
jgi:hypothetical protein